MGNEVGWDKLGEESEGEWFPNKCTLEGSMGSDMKRLIGSRGERVTK